MGRYLRYATRDDLVPLFEIEEAAFAEDGFSIHLLEMCLQHGSTFIILEQDLPDGEAGREILGFIIITEEKKSKHVNLEGRIAHIVNFAINPIMQNQGHGSYFLEIVTRGYKKDFDWIKLEVKTENACAIHLYEKFGFKIAEKIQNYYQSGADCYIMALQLTDD